MIHVPCPVCHSENNTKLLSGTDRIRGSEDDFTLVTCNDCGLIFLNPRPDAGELAEHYDEGYREWQAPTSGFTSFFRRAGVRRKVAAVAGEAGRGRVLDVGCGYGDFLAEAARSGFETFGTELDFDQADRAARASGAQVKAGTLESCGFPPSSFDVITMWHVLEHLPDPVGSLKAASELLKPGGAIVVAVPDAGSRAARFFKEYWAGYDMPRHLMDFSAPVLEATLRRAGFQPAKRSYFMGTYDNLRISLEFLIKGRLRPGRLERLLLALVGNPLTRLFLTPAAMLLQRSGRGSVVTCFARKGR